MNDRSYRRFQRLYSAWKHAQTSVITPPMLAIVGALAIIFGEHSSKAFANIGGANAVRFMGTLLVIGSVLTMWGILNNQPFKEVVGLFITAVGTAIYSGGAFLGLGTQGLISGLGYLSITLTLLTRIYLISQASRPGREGHPEP